MATASLPSRQHEVEIIARDLPGDELALDWASPWAGAVFLGLDGSNEREQKMQLDSFAMLWSLAVTNPESSVKRIEMLDYHDDKTIDQIWYAGKYRVAQCGNGLWERLGLRFERLQAKVISPNQLSYGDFQQNYDSLQYMGVDRGAHHPRDVSKG